MIDNFDIIKPLFYFNEANNMFFHLQILRRGKDHPELPAANKLIRSWLVRSREQLGSLKDEIVFLCEHYKARAYINVAGKDFNRLNTLILKNWLITFILAILSIPGMSIIALVAN